MKKTISITFFLVSTLLFSQEIPLDSISLQIVNDTITLDKNELIDHKEATLIDSLWLKEMYTSPLYDTIQFVLKDTELLHYETEQLSTATLKERLEKLNNKTPFHLEYNQSLETIIKSYLKHRKRSFARLIGKAQYYFPMFEEYLDKYDIPLEIKYLAIVESALKPRAKSRVGATGLWQFMYQTGKQFDLNVSSYVDERYDPIRATEAACKYLSSLYKIFGDWDLALAAYNSGPGNVSKAIRRSGGKTNYWNIRHNLPRETAGYLPAFYATLYMIEYADEHNIVPLNNTIPYFKTDTIHVKSLLTFDQITEVLKVDTELLQFLNPQYKLDIIPYIKDKNYTLTLPTNLIGKFVSNESQIYAYAASEEAKREKPLPEYIEMNDRVVYRVRSGDYLGKIANKFGVSVSSIKRWNGLRSNRLKIGQRLTIHPRKLNTASISKSKPSSKKAAKKQPNGPFTSYVVQTGDSLWTIAQKFPKVSVEQIKEWNNIWSVKKLKPGMVLKIFKS